MTGFLLPSVEDWADWGAIYTDISLWRPVVERVWAGNEQLRAVTGIAAPHRVDAGHPGTCAVFVVDGTAVIKFFPPMVGRDFERERAVYRLLDGTPRLPALLADGVFHDRIDWPYLVTSFVPGEAWRDARERAAAADRATIMGELGWMIRVVHDVPLAATGPWPAMDAWQDLLAARLPQMAAALRRQTALGKTVIAQIEALLGATNWMTNKPRLLHADLTEDHLLLGQQDGRWSVAGLIDWADAEVGDAGYEWVTLWFSICRRDARLFHSFLAGYGAERGLTIDPVNRLTAMLFVHRFGADILGETLTAEEQRGASNLAELQLALFPGLRL